MYFYHILSNGIKLIHKQHSSQVAHCAVFINAGTRDELAGENGIAHFIEHCIFKGTKKRKAFHIINRIDGVGGEMNAYTNKEETCIYASFMHHHYERTLELFSDILFNSVFPQKEIQKEKEVVLDEINSYRDSPSELIFDEFEEFIFGKHPLGNNILGTPKQVRAFSSDIIMQFIERNYCTDKMVISSIGNIDFHKLVYMCEKYFVHQKNLTTENTRKPFTNYQAQDKVVKKRNHQVHLMIGNYVHGFDSDNRIVYTFLSNLLGGPAMNSRLNMAIREKYGYSYNLEANYTPYSDGGIFCIYAGTDFVHKDKTIGLILKEMQKLREIPLTSLQLSSAKTQLIGQMAISNESALNEMLSIGKSYMIYDKVDSLKYIQEQIKAIKPQEIHEVANEIFAENSLSTLIYE